jgi:hypothetical protein
VSADPYINTSSAFGEGTYLVGGTEIKFTGNWSQKTVPAAQLNTDKDAIYSITDETGARVEFPFNGQSIEFTYSVGPDHSAWIGEIDGKPILAAGEPLIIDAYNPTTRFGEVVTLEADRPGEHNLVLINSDQRNTSSSGTVLALGQLKVLPPVRQSSLPTIIGILLGIQVIGLLFAFIFGPPLFTKFAAGLDTRRSIILALVIYSVIAIWGFFLNSTIEYWMLAWMVAIVQGGSQALSRSLYASMSPATKSGEFFGLFGVMEKFSSIIGPLLFALAVVFFGNSRPAILSLIAFFIIGGFLLTRVNVHAGVRVAQAEDAALAG